MSPSKTKRPYISVKTYFINKEFQKSFIVRFCVFSRSYIGPHHGFGLLARDELHHGRHQGWPRGGAYDSGLFITIDPPDPRSGNNP